MEKLLYEFGLSPVKLVSNLKDGELYVTSCGDIYEYIGDNQELIFVQESPLDLTINDNTVENLNEVALDLFWKLCRNSIKY